MEYEGRIVWDTDKPDGQPQEDAFYLRAQKFGFVAKTGFEQGLKYNRLTKIL